LPFGIIALRLAPLDLDFQVGIVRRHDARGDHAQQVVDLRIDAP